LAELKKANSAEIFASGKGKERRIKKNINCTKSPKFVDEGPRRLG